MITFPIDFVLPYVNNYDPVWQQTYKQYCTNSKNKNKLDIINGERYRDFGFLVYLFRGIEKYMPFIRNVFLIVSNIEQVPSWIDQEKVKIILHKDFIPEQFLPTFNSTTIEMFLPDIKELGEHFIYGNDDMFPVGPTTPEDYFAGDGAPKVTFLWNKYNSSLSQYWKVCAKVYHDVKEAIGKTANETDDFLRPLHGLIPIVKSHATRIRNLLKDRIYNSITAFRTDTNYNQYIYSEYENLINNLPQDMSQRKLKSISLNGKILNTVLTAIDSNQYQELLLNDTEKTMFWYWNSVSRFIIKHFNNKFPTQSKYESKDGTAK